jgi:hypothetical protein
MANAQTVPAVVNLVKTASLADVFLALRTPFMGTKIEVTDERGHVFKLSVQGLYHEDGSGRSLVISGYAEMTSTPKMRINGLSSKRYEAYLNFKGGQRRGWIKIFD